VAAHGYLHEDHSQLGEAERGILEKAHTALSRIAGGAPIGWRAPSGLMSRRTLTYLVELGYLYDASFRDDDLPHDIACGNGTTLVEVPQFPFLTDAVFYARFRPPKTVKQVWREEFDAIYDEGLLFSLKLHPRGDTGSGRGLRARAVDELIDEIRRRPRTWFATHRQVAEWWRARGTPGHRLGPVTPA
jgi:peptidoglycan/xylan/chitin deacetylase (PgdA/CDA1 family)